MFKLRHLRWIGVAGALSTLAACNDHRLAAPESSPSVDDRNVYLQNPQLKLDILFMIDDSSSMMEEQQNLIANFPTFMRELERAVPAGNVLDAHVAVVSSDLGTATTSSSTCDQTGGDNGVFRSQPRGACTAGPDGHFLVTNAAGKNFSGTIEQAFSCIANLGIGGCGFEHQLASVRRALGGDPDYEMPPENKDFLRADARLGIILITDEDDCSAPNGSDLFTRDTTTYGPLDSYRCNQYGHLCGGAPPPYAVVSGLTCESNETDTSRLVHVSDFVQFLRDLKPNPTMLRLAAITGPATPYGTYMDAADANKVKISPSCQSPGLGSAAPAIRIHQLLEAFGPAAAFESICAGDFGPAMEHIAAQIAKQVVPCVPDRIYDTDLAQAGIQPDCTVTETTYTNDGDPVEAGIPSCADTAGATPCWRLAPNGECTASPGMLAVDVDHGAGPAAPNTNTKWTCRVCPTAGDPACAR